MEGAGEEVEGGGRRESEGSGRGEGQWGAHLHFRLPFSVDGGCGREEQVGLGRAVGAAPWTLRAASRSPADPRAPAGHTGEGCVLFRGRLGPGGEAAALEI